MLTCKTFMIGLPKSSMISSPTTLPLVHSTPASLASMLFLEHSKHIPTLCQVFPWWNSSPLGIHITYSHTFIRSLLKCHLSVRHSLAPQLKLYFLDTSYPHSLLYFFLCTYHHLARYIFYLLLLLIVCHFSIECKLHKRTDFFTCLLLYLKCLELHLAHSCHSITISCT